MIWSKPPPAVSKLVAGNWKAITCNEAYLKNHLLLSDNTVRIDSNRASEAKKPSNFQCAICRISWMTQQPAIHLYCHNKSNCLRILIEDFTPLIASDFQWKLKKQNSASVMTQNWLFRVAWVSIVKWHCYWNTNNVSQVLQEPPVKLQRSGANVSFKFYLNRIPKISKSPIKIVHWREKNFPMRFLFVDV